MLYVYSPTPPPTDTAILNNGSESNWLTHSGLNKMALILHATFQLRFTESNFWSQSNELYS